MIVKSQSMKATGNRKGQAKGMKKNVTKPKKIPELVIVEYNTKRVKIQ